MIYHYDFEKQLLKLLYTNRQFYNNYSGLIKVEYFDEQPLRILWTIIDEAMASIDGLVLNFSKILIHIDSYCIKQGLSTDTFSRLKTHTKDVDTTHIENEAWVEERVLNYIKRQEFKKALILSTDILAKDGDYEQAVKLINEAVSIGAGSSESYSWDNLIDFPKKYCEMYSPEKLVPTGFTKYDTCFGGGFAPGEIHLVFAPTGIGKTTLGVDMGLGAMLHGKSVYHVTMEVSKEIVLAKYAARATNTPLQNFLCCDINEYNDKIKVYKEKFMPFLRLEFWPDKSITTMTIRSWISQKMSKAEGKKPDLIIVDWDDCLRPTVEARTGDMYNEGGNIYSDLLQLAHYFKCPILTFGQSNREGIKKNQLEKEFNIDTGDNTTDIDIKKLSVAPLLSSDLAQSAKKLFACSSVTSLNFIDEVVPTGYLYVCKVRRGVAGKFIVLNRDLSMALIKEKVDRKI